MFGLETKNSIYGNLSHKANYPRSFLIAFFSCALTLVFQIPAVVKFLATLNSPVLPPSCTYYH